MYTRRKGILEREHNFSLFSVLLHSAKKGIFLSMWLLIEIQHLAYTVFFLMIDFFSQVINGM